MINHCLIFFVCVQFILISDFYKYCYCVFNIYFYFLFYFQDTANKVEVKEEAVDLQKEKPQEEKPLEEKPLEKETEKESSPVVVKTEQSDETLIEQKEIINSVETPETEKKEEEKVSESSTADKKEVCSNIFFFDCYIYILN